MSIRAFILAALAVTLVAASIESDFAAFKAEYDRNYATDVEESKAFSNFRANVARIAELSARNPQATFGINKFADMDAKEFAAKRHGAKRPEVVNAPIAPTSKLTAIPPVVNWVKAGYSLPVLDMGECGGAWAFSAVENIQGVNFATNKKLVGLSVQELLDCDTLDSACNGGIMENAYQWILNNQHGNIMTSKSWPYDGTSDACSFNNRVVGATITNYTNIPKSEADIAKYVATVGPVAVAVDASSWEMYMGGVLTNCPASSLDDAATIVGYNDNANPPYWMIKNQWGSDWGMEGYIYIAKGTNACGVQESAITAFVKKD